jgi:phosphoenolpyruvate carboxykinase (ATP)
MTHNLLNINTPAQKHAKALKSDFGLENHGLVNLNQVYWNLPAESLYEEIVFRGEGHISRYGPIVVDTGNHTARAANDKYVVRESSTEENIWWGEYNRPYNPEAFSELISRLQGYAQGRDLGLLRRFGSRFSITCTCSDGIRMA